MAVPVWVTNQVLTASDVNQWLAPLAAYKTATESVTSSVALQPDNDLFLTVAANAVYQMELVIIYTGDASGDLKTGWTIPAGASLSIGLALGLTPGAAAVTDDITSSAAGGTTGPAFGAITSGTNLAAYLTYVLTTAGTAGTLQFTWAQNASFATATSLLAGSHLFLQRIG